MSHQALTFRPANIADAAAVCSLIESAFRAEDTRPDWTADMRLGAGFSVNSDDVVRQISKAPDGVILLAAFAGQAELIACVELTKKPDDVGRLSMLAVNTAHQQGGLGRQLLEAAEEYVKRAWACKIMSLNALSSRKLLIEWYERRGYVRIGKNSPFPVEILKAAGIEEDLFFVELEKKL